MWFITHKVNTQNTHLTSKTPSSLYSYPCLSLLSFLAKSVHWWLCFVLIFEKTWQKFAFNWRKKPSTCQNLHFRYREFWRVLVSTCSTEHSEWDCISNKKYVSFKWILIELSTLIKDCTIHFKCQTIVDSFLFFFYMRI